MGFKNKNKMNMNNGMNIGNDMNTGTVIGAPKIKAEKVKSVSKFSRTRNILLVLALVVVVVIGVNVVSSMQLKDVVNVVKLTSAVPQDGLIRTDNMYSSEMSKVEYERQGVVTLSDGTKKRAIVLWDEREDINNTYASYYIRQDTPLYWDAIGAETPKQYSYLYNMDGELLKIGISADTFGEMLVPGDHINIRAAYEETVYKLPTEAEYIVQQQTGISAQTSIKRQILLFNNCAVLDILNAEGASIYDIYYELLSMPKNDQASVINSEEFKASVQPTEILLNVTPEEADRYMSIQASGPTYMMTLLPRTSSNAITEVLNELATGFARASK